MTIFLHCPRCQAALKAGDHLAGILGYCPKCGGTLLFPGERQTDDLEQAKPAPAEAEAGLSRAERTAAWQGFWDRLRLRTAQPWLISLVVHAAAVGVLGVLTWQVAGSPADSGRKVNILLDLGEKEGSLRYQGPRDIVLKEPPKAEADLLSELGKDRPESHLLEVGPARGAPVLRLTDLDFQTGLTASGFSTQFMGVGARGESFVYIVDKSGSMRGERLDAAKAELRASLEMLPYAAKFHVIFYDDGPYREMPASALANASRQNKQRCYELMADVPADGGTNPLNEKYNAFRKAFDLRPDIIFFLTDAEAFPARVAERVRLMNVERARDKTTIHTICFIERTGELLLQQIARENHGTYRFVGEAEALRLLDRRGVRSQP